MTIKYIVYGGSFDPITFAHVGMARLARRLYPTAELYWCLGDTHAFKDKLSPYEFRMSLIQKAVPDASIISMGKYMCDFLYNFPFEPDNTTILVGDDILNEIHLWKDWEELVETYHFTIVTRPAMKKEKICVDNFKRMRYTDVIENEGVLRTSSSEVRQMVKEGKKLYGYIPRQIRYEVEKYYVN